MNLTTESYPAPKSVLIVEDLDAIRRMLAEMLQWMGYTCAMAADGVEAVALLGGEKFDLVLTDFAMPRMNGRELIFWMRKHHLDTPVFLMSSDVSNYQFRLAMEPFVDGLLAKPFSRNELDSCLKKTLAQRAATPSVD